MKDYLELENKITYSKLKDSRFITIFLENKPIAFIDLTNNELIMHDSENFEKDIIYCEHRVIKRRGFENALITMKFFKEDTFKMFDYELNVEEIEYLIYIYDRFITNKEVK